MPDDAVVYFEWEPPPAEIAQTLLKVAEYVERVEAPLLAARRIAMDDMEAHFDTETDPYGNQWAPLSEGYAEDKAAAGYPDNILVRTGALKAAATSDAAWEIVGEDLIFNAGSLPEYGMAHQTGARREKSDLPARPFIGLSDEAEAKILVLFETWYEEGSTRLWIRPTGTVQTRGEGGRFSSNFNPEF